MSEIKIATCCYCGSRAALALRGKVRHELACRTCGAPLRALKRLRADPAPAPARRPVSVRGPGGAPEPARPRRDSRRPLKHRKTLLTRALDFFDEIEDLFD